MKKIFLITLLFSSISYADLDIGEDFEAGDLVSAEEFNQKFGKLKKVVGEIKDQELLGSWDCTNYKLTQGNDNHWYYQANTGRLILSELDPELSIVSPKNWTIDTADIINFDNYVEGSYMLLINKLHLFIDNENLLENYHPSSLIGTYFINMLDEDKMMLDMGDQTYSNILCEKIE